ncbi:polyketide synthase dehydratase domain-containing protein [Priestia megaterium]
MLQFISASRFYLWQYISTYSKIYSNSQEALSYLELPSECTENFDEFVLHPSLMDGAFQTLLGLVNSSGSDSTEMYVPFSIKEIEIKDSLKEKCYVYVTLIENNKNSKTFNLQVMDEDGKVLVVIKQLSLRTLQAPKNPLISNKVHCFSDWEEAPLGASMLVREWQGSLLLLDTEKHTQDLLIEQLPRGVNVVLVKIGESFRFLGDNTYEMNPAREEDYSHLIESLRDRGMAPEYILHHWSKEDGIIDDDKLPLQLERGIYSLLHLTKALMKLKAKHKIRLLYTYESWGEIKPLDAAVAGFAKTIRLEHPKLVYKTLEIQKDSEDTVSTAKSVSLMIKELMSELDHEYEVCYKNGIRFTKQLKEIINDNKSTSMVSFRKKVCTLLPEESVA